jgi:hypothetical protein
MALVLADRVRETTITTGQGSVSLAGAVPGYQTFSVIGNTNTTYYCIAGQGTSEWEVGIGTYTSSGASLSRDTVLASSAGAPTKTNFSAGVKDVFVTYPAERSVYANENDTTVTVPSLTTGGNLTFTGTGNRITGNFGTGTVDTRILFQNSNSNAQTNIVAVENGTTTTATGAAQLVVAESGYATNGNAAVGALLLVKNTDVRISSSILNSGTYLPMTFHTGGSERMRIGTTGNVGIGTSSPDSPLQVSGQAKFGLLANPVRVNSSAGTGILEFSSTTNVIRTLGATPLVFQTNGNNDRMFIDSTGNVGIGVVSPAVKLDVDGTIATRAASGEGGQLEVNNPDNASIGLIVDVSTADVGRVFQNRNNSVLQIGQLAGTGGIVQFFTATSERMRIDSSGNVGIGTSSPGAPLDVVANSSAYNLRVRGRSSDNISTIQFTDNAASTEYAFIRAPAANTLSFATASSERMRIDSSGNVGIGTSSPASRLQLSGVNSNNGAHLRLANTTASTGKTYQIASTDDGSLFFSIPGVADRVVIDSGGSILIGTTTDRGRVTVEGGSIVAAGTPSANWGLDFAPSTASPTCITLANDATYDLASGSGLVMLVVTDGTASGIAYCAFGAVNVLSSISTGSVTNAVNNANTLNLYYNAGTAKYRIQNKLGGSKNIFVSTIRGRDAT